MPTGVSLSTTNSGDFTLVGTGQPVGPQPSCSGGTFHYLKKPDSIGPLVGTPVHNFFPVDGSQIPASGVRWFHNVGSNAVIGEGNLAVINYNWFFAGVSTYHETATNFQALCTSGASLARHIDPDTGVGWTRAKIFASAWGIRLNSFSFDTQFQCSGITIGLEYWLTPTVSSIDVNCGPVAGGTGFVISGTEFFNEPGFATQVQVKFGGTAATGVSYGNTSISGTTPAHASGTVDVDIIITYPDATTTTLTLTNGFTFAPCDGGATVGGDGLYGAHSGGAGGEGGGGGGANSSGVGGKGRLIIQLA